MGKRLLMTVSDIMRTGEDNPAVHENATVQDMLCEITSKRSGAVSVIDDDGNLLGLVTDYDIRQALEQGEDFLSLSIPEIMNPNPTYVWSDEKAAKLLGLMEDRSKPFLVVPVLDRDSRKVIGMIHLHDLVAQGL